MAKSIGGWVVVALGLAALPGTAVAQSASVEGRVTRLESEMRAVQRKVFPGGGLVSPDIVPPDAAPATLGTPAGSAIGDLTSRIDALEGQQQTLTGQVEQLQYRTRQLEDAFAAYKKTTDARLQALEDARASVGTAAPPPRDVPPRDAPDTAAPPVGSGAAPAAGAAVEAPSTGDPAEDAYLLGYRLWAAHRYADAATQLKSVVAEYPKSRRASYAQNLLGRSYLDDGKLNLAATTFYDNYKKMPDGERAPDSLYFLAQALTQLKKPADACKVYGELDDVYAAKMGADLKAKVTAGRAAAKCQ